MNELGEPPYDPAEVARHYRPDLAGEPARLTNPVLGDKVWMVRNLEDPDTPIVGELVEVVEDAVDYIDAEGIRRRAPYDCVRIEAFVVTKTPESEAVAETLITVGDEMARCLAGLGAELRRRNYDDAPLVDELVAAWRRVRGTT